MLDFRITLEARNPARRCLRQYHVEAGTDLFGVWVVEITYGRIGTAGRSRSYVLRDEGEARQLAQSILKRRASAAPHRGRVPHPRNEVRPDFYNWCSQSELLHLAEGDALRDLAARSP